MTANSRWGKVKERLKASSQRDFEQAALPLLRIKWANLATPKAMGYLDEAGLDHCVIGSGSPIEVVVQCKGFQIHEPLGEDHISQMHKSVYSFIDSPHSCQTYLLVYNRQATDRDFAMKLEVLMDLLVASGKAQEAFVWDLDLFQKNINAALVLRLQSEIQRAGEQLEAKHSRFWPAGLVISKVPYLNGVLQMRAGSPPTRTMSEKGTVGDATQALKTTGPKTQWTLVYGRFGAGKSSITRRLASQAGHHILYVPAVHLRHIERSSPSENNLTEAIVEYLGIFEVDGLYTDEESASLAWLAGPLMAAILRNPDSKITLVIDGLDENRVYSSMYGLQMLTAELGRASCDVVLTTRREHFFDHYASYAEPLTKVSPFATDGMKLLELENWSTPQIHEYIEKARSMGNASQSASLEQLQSSMALADTTALQHPLLLAMTVDLVAQEGVGAIANTAELYLRWIRMKLMRDFEAHGRRVAPGFENIAHTIQETVRLMEEVAHAMTERDAEEVRLVETIKEDYARALAVARFGPQVPSDIYTVTSLLEPSRTRSVWNGLHLTFFHRSFQEFFLASYLVRCEQDSGGFPPEVREMVRQLMEVDISKH